MKQLESRDAPLHQVQSVEWSTAKVVSSVNNMSSCNVNVISPIFLSFSQWVYLL